MREDKIKIGETVICVESGVVGEVIDFYTREGSEKEKIGRASCRERV